VKTSLKTNGFHLRTAKNPRKHSIFKGFGLVRETGLDLDRGHSYLKAQMNGV